MSALIELKRWLSGPKDKTGTYENVPVDKSTLVDGDWIWEIYLNGMEILHQFNEPVIIDPPPVRILSKDKWMDRLTIDEIGMLRELYNLGSRQVVGFYDWLAPQMAVDMDNQRVVDFFNLVVSKYGATDNLPTEQNLIDSTRRDEILSDATYQELL
jgi:hypothetical protein